MAAPNLSELAKKRFEVVRSPDGRITNYYDKQTGRTLSQTEFNNFMQQQSGLPAPFQAFEPNSIGSIMGRLDELIPFAEQLGLAQPGVLPLDQQKPDVMMGTVTFGGKGSDKGMPTPTATPSNTSPFATYEQFTDALFHGDPVARDLHYSGKFSSIPGAPQMPATGSRPAMPAGTGSRPAVTGVTGSQPAMTGVTGSRPAMTGVTGSQPAMTGVTGSQPAMTGVTGSQPAMPTLPPGPPPPGRAPLPNTTPPGRASLPAGMPPPPPAGAPPAAVKSWFGKLSGKQKAALGVVGAGAVGYAVINKAADTARKQPASAGQPDAGQQWEVDPNSIPYGNPANKPETSKPSAGKTPMPSRAANVLRAASAAQGQAGPQPQAAVAATATDKVPVTTSGRPDYNYYAEMMNAADRNDAYARDLINLKEQARMAAIDAGARGEKFRFVPVKDYMNNRIIFVNAGGNDVVLDMNDPRQGVEYQKLLEKSGVDAATMTDWIHRSSKPMLRYMQPAGGNRDVMPDFGYARRSVEMGEGKPATPETTSLATPEVPKPTAVPPTRPEPQPTSVAAFDETRPAEAMQRESRRQLDEYKPKMSVAQALTQGTPSPVEEAKRLGWDYETNEPRAPIPMSEEEQGIRRAEEYWKQNPQFKPGVTIYKTKVTTRRR